MVTHSSVRGVPLIRPGRHGSGQPAHSLLRLRYILLGGLVLTVLLPMMIRQFTTGITITQPTQYNTALGGAVAMILGVIGYRRLQVFSWHQRR